MAICCGHDNAEGAASMLVGVVGCNAGAIWRAAREYAPDTSVENPMRPKTVCCLATAAADVYVRPRDILGRDVVEIR